MELCPVCLHRHPTEEMHEDTHLHRGRVVTRRICWFCLIGDFEGDWY